MDQKVVGAVMGVLGAAEVNSVIYLIMLKVFGGVVLGKLSDIIGRKVVVVGAILVYSGRWNFIENS